MTNTPESEASCWMVLGNIIQQRYYGEDHEIRDGTKHFRGGAKVHVVADFPGMAETVTVVGVGRSGRFRTITMPVWFIENIRAKVVYSPTVLKQREVNGSIWRTEVEVREAVENYQRWVGWARSSHKENGRHWPIVEY